MTAEDYNKAVEAGQIPEETQSQITAVVTEKMATDEIQEKIKTTTEEKINELIEQNMQSDDVQTQINAAVEKGKAGSTAITELKEQLDSYNQFYQGVLTYTKGVDTAKTGSDKLVAGAKSLKKGTKTLKSGTKSLKKGTKTLAKGTKTLDSGVNKLLEGSEALVSGVTKLKDGSMTLTNGLKQYKKEGVQKLVDVVNGDVKGLLNRFKTISKVSADYKSYSGISDSMNGKVDFIYKTDSIEE
jgi:putative membrane protein